MPGLELNAPYLCRIIIRLPKHARGSWQFFRLCKNNRCRQQECLSHWPVFPQNPAEIVSWCKKTQGGILLLQNAMNLMVLGCSSSPLEIEAKVSHSHLSISNSALHNTCVFMRIEIFPRIPSALFSMYYKATYKS